MLRRLLHLRRLLRLIPKLLKALDILEVLQPKLEADLLILEETVRKFENLDACLSRIESAGRRPVEAQAVAVAATKNGTHAEERYGWNRLQMIAKFASLTGKAKEIEQEWQRIQQDEHDEHFAFQVLRGSNESTYLYKKGIADGIKWCVEHFS